jgi:hypothetical protein
MLVSAIADAQVGNAASGILETVLVELIHIRLHILDSGISH